MNEIRSLQPTIEELKDLAKSWNVERIYKAIDKTDKRIKSLAREIDMLMDERRTLVQIYDKKRLKEANRYTQEWHREQFRKSKENRRKNNAVSNM